MLSCSTLHRLPIYESADAFTNVFRQMAGMAAKEEKAPSAGDVKTSLA